MFQFASLASLASPMTVDRYTRACDCLTGGDDANDADDAFLRRLDGSGRAARAAAKKSNVISD